MRHALADEISEGGRHLLSAKIFFGHTGNDWESRRGQYLFDRNCDGHQFPEPKKELLTLIDGEPA